MFTSLRECDNCTRYEQKEQNLNLQEQTAECSCINVVNLVYRKPVNLVYRFALTLVNTDCNVNQSNTFDNSSNLYSDISRTLSYLLSAHTVCGVAAWGRRHTAGSVSLRSAAGQRQRTPASESA